MQLLHIESNRMPTCGHPSAGVLASAIVRPFVGSFLSFPSEEGAEHQSALWKARVGWQLASPMEGGWAQATLRKAVLGMLRWRALAHTVEKTGCGEVFRHTPNKSFGANQPLQSEGHWSKWKNGREPGVWWWRYTLWANPMEWNSS